MSPAQERHDLQARGEAGQVTVYGKAVKIHVLLLPLPVRKKLFLLWRDEARRDGIRIAGAGWVPDPHPDASAGVPGS